MNEDENQKEWIWSHEKAIHEIKRLERYEKLVHFIANDYYELSYDKIKWQRDDWKKLCQKLIVEDHPEPPIGHTDEELTKDLDF